MEPSQGSSSLRASDTPETMKASSVVLHVQTSCDFVRTSVLGSLTQTNTRDNSQIIETINMFEILDAVKQPI